MYIYVYIDIYIYTDLKSNVKLVIREADKGCSVVVMDRQPTLKKDTANLMTLQCI